jgi:hypothetical protein
MLSRRSFLRFGVAGTLLLAAAGVARSQLRYRPARADEPLQALRAGDGEVLGAIAPVILAGTAAAGADGAAVVASVDRAVSGLPPHLQSEVRQLLALLASWPGRRLLAGITVPWREASAAQVHSFLEQWRFSRWALQQQGYHALHDLVLAAWYARPDAWPAIAYPGPPVVR